MQLTTYLRLMGNSGMKKRQNLVMRSITRWAAGLWQFEQTNVTMPNVLR